MNDKHDDAATDLLIKEVDEDLRQERLQKLWKKHGILLSIGAMAIVLSVAGWQGWNAYQLKQRQASSARYTEVAGLLEQGKRDAAMEVLQGLGKDGTKGYRLLAELRLADLKLQQGDADGAKALYQKVSETGSVDKIYRDMASIRAAYLSLDKVDPSQLERTLDPLAAESSPWRHSAREIQALAALKRGDGARAADLFGRIAEDGAAPQGIRARAAEMLAATGQKPRS